MNTFVGLPPFSNSLWVAMETMHIHIAHTIYRTPSFRIPGVRMNKLAPLKNCPGVVQGNLNWMPGYLGYYFILLINVTMATLFGILTFIFMINFMLS